MNNRIRYKFNILYLVICILWPLFQRIYFNGIDGAGRIQIFLLIVGTLLNLKAFSKTPKYFYIWLIWIIYSIINTFIKGFPLENISFVNWVMRSLLFPYITMLIAFTTFKYNYDKTVKIIFYIFLLYAILGGISFEKFDSYDIGERAGNEMGNEFLNTVIFTTMFAFLYFLKYKKNNGLVYFSIFITFLIVVISGQRKSLFSMLLMFFISIYAIISNNNFTIIEMIFF